MKALVTGATGFLGQRLCVLLQEQGWDVLGVGRNAIKGAWLTHQGIEFINADLTQSSALNGLDSSIDVVFHGAALSTLWGPYEDFYLANVKATEHVAQACVTHGISRLIHVSTPSIYFDYKHQRNRRESDPLPSQFVNHYAHTKHQAEALLRDQFSESLSFSIIRPRGIFGPGDPSIMPRLLQLAERGKIPLPRGGSALIDVTYVDNVCDAMIALATAGSHTHGETYNITNQEPTTVKGLLDQMSQALGRPFSYRHIPYWLTDRVVALNEQCHRWRQAKEPRITRYGLGLLAFDQTLNTDKAVADFQYTPNTPINEGVQRYVESL